MNEIEQSPKHDDEKRGDDALNGGSPEPPERYGAGYRHMDEPDASRGQTAMRPGSEFESTRKLANASKIMAVVSLLIGGVLLSSAALITSVVAYRKAVRLSEPVQTASFEGQATTMLTRTARASIVVSVLALVLNAVALIYLAPMLMQVMEAGDYASILGSAQQVDSSGSSFWG